MQKQLLFLLFIITISCIPEKTKETVIGIQSYKSISTIDNANLNLCDNCKLKIILN